MPQQGVYYINSLRHYLFKESKGYIFYTFFILPGSQTEIVSDHARDDREKYENYRERSQIRVSNTVREE